MHAKSCDCMDCSPLGLPCLWDIPGKNNGVGCHFLFNPKPAIEPESPVSPALQANSLLLEPSGNPDVILMGFPCSSAVKKNLPTMGRPGFDFWVGKIPWRREQLPTSVFLPGEFHGQRSLVGYSPLGLKESDRKLTHFTFQGWVKLRWFSWAKQTQPGRHGVAESDPTEWLSLSNKDLHHHHNSCLSPSSQWSYY